MLGSPSDRRAVPSPPPARVMPDSFSLSEWSPLLPGVALWALALYLPLSLPLGRLEESLAAGPLDGGLQQLLLTVASLLLALAAGLVTDLVLGWALGPGWAGSLGLMAALWGLFWGLVARRQD